MKHYAWSKDNEIKFELDVFIFKNTQKDSAAFTHTGRGTKLFKQYLSKKQNVGIIFVPHDKKDIDNDGFVMSTAYMLGVNNLVPDDIDVVLIVSPPKQHVKFDIRNTMLNYNSKHRILIDLEFDKPSVCDSSMFSIITTASASSWVVSPKLRLRNQNSKFSRIYSVIETLVREDDLLYTILGANENSLSETRRMLERRNSMLTEEQAEQFAQSLMNARAELYELAKRVFKVKTFGYFDIIPFKNHTIEDIKLIFLPLLENERLVARYYPNTRSYSSKNSPSFDDMWKTVHKYVHQIDKRWISLFCTSENTRDGDYIADIVKFTQYSSTVNTIWHKVLFANNCPFTLSHSWKNNFISTKEQQEIENIAIRSIGELYGVDCIIRSYAEGVPIEDILV